MAEATELDRLKDRRTTLVYRLDLIAKGAQLTYEDGTLVDMASEKARLEDEVGLVREGSARGRGRSPRSEDRPPGG